MNKLLLWFRIWLWVVGTLCAVIGAFGMFLGFAFAFVTLLEHGHWVWAMLMFLFIISGIITSIEYNSKVNRYE